MDPLFLGALVAIITIVVLFSGVSVAIGLLIVSAGFLITFDGLRSLELMPEILFGKLDSFALLSIPMFIIMGSSIASTRAGGFLESSIALRFFLSLCLSLWALRLHLRGQGLICMKLLRDGLRVSRVVWLSLILEPVLCLLRCLALALQLVRLLVRWVFQRCASVDILTALLQALLLRGERLVFLFHHPSR